MRDVIGSTDALAPRFPTQQIYAWRGAGVFGADGVLARRVDAEGKPLDTEWTRLKADPPVPRRELLRESTPLVLLRMFFSSSVAF